VVSTGGMVEERIVTTGQAVDDLVEVTSGLTEGNPWPSAMSRSSATASASRGEVAVGVGRGVAETFMQWLAALCVRRPVFASVLILSLTVVGMFSFRQLGIDQFPTSTFRRSS
jgi:hypothetical protein